MSFLAELKQRKVFRIAAAYLVVAWLAVQVASIALPAFEAPSWAMRSTILLFALGFPLALLLAWSLELTPDGLKLDLRQGGSKRMLAIAAAIAVLVLGWFFRDSLLPATTTATAAPPAAATLAKPANSIAVLPLTNASGDAGQQFFSDGLSENLIIALSQFEGLTVIGRRSSFQFRDGGQDARSIGTALGVAYLLEGSVQHVGDAVRISAELVNTSDGRALWSQRYDRPYKDLFALQDEIAQAVATALKAKLLPGAASAGDRPPGGSLAAYDAFLQGRFFGDRGTAADNEKAIAALRLATRIDPRYAMAWALMADAWMTQSNSFLGGEPQRQGWVEARKAADTALALAPDLGLAHAVRSRLLAAADRDWEQSQREARRGIELAPTDRAVRFAYSLSLASSGRIRQAVASHREGLSNDPLDPAAHRHLGRLYFGLGQLDEAEASTRRAIELQPGAPTPLTWLAFIQILRGQTEAAIATARQIAPGDGWRETALAMALASGPDRAAADAALQHLIDTNSEENAYQIAEVYALRGDADKTFEWLQHAARTRDPGFAILLFDPFILRFREDPRLAAFCASVGLPPPSQSDALGIDQIRAKLAAAD